MKVPHPDPRPSRPPARALPPGWLAVAFALAPLLLAGCGDNLAANCPTLAHPEMLTVVASSNPCQARKGESAKPILVVATVPRSSMERGR